MTRRAGLELFYNSVNISSYLRPHLKGWNYTDNMSGQSDDLNVTLEDREQLWAGDWFPEKGATLTAAIMRENWSADGAKDGLNIGIFEVDELETGHPPSTVTIKALSIPEGSASLRKEQKNKAWEDVPLSVVAGDIAGDNGMGLFYDSGYDPNFDRLEQTEQTDLEFLQKLCGDAGLSLKIAEGKIIIFEDARYEQQDPVGTIERGKDPIVSYLGRTTLNGVYSACIVEYTDASTKETYRYKFEPSGAPKTGKILYINQRVTSIKEAEALAKRKLRQENSKETEFSITIPGDIKYLAALTVILKSFGAFDGKYIITQAVHGQQDKYETKLQLRKCLEGY